MANRTNNALKRYNRYFNNIVPQAHPNLVVFSAALLKEARHIVDRCDDVHLDRERAPNYNAATFPDIPDDFDSFRYKMKKDSQVGPRKNPKRKTRSGKKK